MEVEMDDRICQKNKRNESETEDRTTGGRETRVISPSLVLLDKLLDLD